MLNRSEPNFELLDHDEHKGALTIVFVLIVGVLIAAVGWSWLLARQAQAALGHRQAVLAATAAASSAAPQSKFSEAAMRDAHGAAQLLQAPLADWFLELEHCKADGGVLELLRVDTAQARVHVQASLPDDAMVSGWLTCLNAGLPVPAWRMQRIAAADRPPVPGGLPGWTVVLERSATGPADSKQ